MPPVSIAAGKPEECLPNRKQQLAIIVANQKNSGTSHAK